MSKSATSFFLNNTSSFLAACSFALGPFISSGATANTSFNNVLDMSPKPSKSFTAPTKLDHSEPSVTVVGVATALGVCARNI